MNKYEKFIPEGMRDLLFEECNTRKMLQNEICRKMSFMGYNCVETPSVEFFDLFNRNSAGVQCEEMYKMTDRVGRLAVMRPDNTLPIARLVSTRLRSSALPLRLYYNQNVFRQNPRFAGYSDEILQSGAELIGQSGLRADLEILALSVNAVTSCNSLDFRIELGHAGFYKLLLERLNADIQVKEHITELIESKNVPALNVFLDSLGEDSRIISVLKSLPTLFGDASVLKRASELFNDEKAYEILKYLGGMYDGLSQLGFGGKISIDLGLVHRSSYYTGIIFRGYVEGSGIAVLTGGRYDSLLGELGKTCPAVGFAVDVDALTQAIIRSGGAVEAKKPEVLVFGGELMEMQQQIYSQKLASDGVICQNWLTGDFSEALAYANANGIHRIDRITDGKVESIEV